MASIGFRGFFVIISILAISSTSSSYKLNVPKVLLPFRSDKETPPINYTLEITDANDRTGASCFNWRSSKPDTVEVHSMYGPNQKQNQPCSSQAVVSAVSRYASRRTAIVSAEDKHSGTVLRCDVMVDSLSSLEIVTTTRQLYLEDSPELFIVRAKNNEGDTFADLDGLTFDWTVESAAAVGHHSSPARIVPFAESEYTTTDAIRRLESRRLRGDRILVEGISTGVAVITVRSRDEQYRKSIEPYSIKLTVMAFLTLEPSADIRVPIGARIHYLLKLIRYRKAETIPMPSTQYRINAESIESESGAEVARFHEKSSILEAMALGTVRLMVEDRKLDSSIASYELPSANVFVVEPATIRFTVCTGIWVFEIGQSYEVTIDLLDDQGRALYLTENTLIDVLFPNDLVRASQISASNGTVWQIVPLKEGIDKISAKYESYLDAHGTRQYFSPAIEGEQSFEVYPSMSITPPVLIFPPCYHVPTSGVCFEETLTVHGGSGQFAWATEILNSTSTAPARISVQGVGGRRANVASSNGASISALATATDVKNRQHKTHAKIVVTDPVEADFIDGPREVEIGAEFRLGLRLRGKVRMSEERLVPFTNCRHLAFGVHVSNEAALGAGKPLDSDEKTTHVGEGDDACVTFSFVGKSIGNVMVTVDIPAPGGFGSLTASVPVSVYAPLKVNSPFDNLLLVTPTSTFDIAFAGGPHPLPSDPSSHFVTAEVLGKIGADYFETSSIVDVDSPSVDNTKAYSVMVACLSGTPAPSETSVLITIGNKKTPTNKFPAMSTVSVKIVCDFPSSLALQLRRKRAHESTTLPPCPLDNAGGNTPIPVYAKSKFDVLAHMFDNGGRRFDNASALLFSWRISDSSLFRSPANRPHSLQWRASGDVDYEFYESFQPVGAEGDVKVTAEVASVADDACSLKNRKTCEDFLRRVLKTSILVRLVSYASLSPSTVVLYNHPSNNAVLNIVGGSGQYFLATNENRENPIVIYRLIEDGRKVNVKPSGGEIGEITLNLHDVCLTESPPAQATIVVSSIEKLVLTGPSLVMLGNRLTLRVQAMDQSGRQLDAQEIFKFLPLGVHVDGAGLNRRIKKESTDSKLAFDAVDIGAVGVSVSITDPGQGRTIRSPVHRVQVFPSLEVEPRSITLIPGARFQVRITGGLQHSSSSWFIDPISSGVAFSVNDSKVIKIDASGLMEAKRHGYVSVTARLANPEKLDEILGEDTITVRVIQLASIKIHSPSTTIYAGMKLPLTFVGHAHRDQPTNYLDSSTKTDVVFPWGVGSADAPLKAIWYADGDGAQLDGSTTEHVAGSVHLLCSKPGVVHVRLSVEQSNPDVAKLQFIGGRRTVLNASLSITVLAYPISLVVNHDSTVSSRHTQHLRNQRLNTQGESQGLISIDENGRLRAMNQKDRFGDVSVWTDAPDSVAFTVSVRAVSYMMASTMDLEKLVNHWSHGDYPISYVIKFAINYHERHGRKFDAVHRSAGLSVRPNRFDLIDITMVKEEETDYLIVRLKDVGETVIKIWDTENPVNIFDYIRINAARAIQPSATTIQIGQRVRFANALSARSGDGGEFTWSSSNPNAIAIDHATGFAVARSPGQSTVSHALREDGHKFTTSTLITVVEPKSIELEKMNGAKAIVDSDDGAETIFAVKFHGGADIVEESFGAIPDLVDVKVENSLLSSEQLPFTCEFQISPPAVSNPDAYYFRIRPTYVSSIGFACVLKKLAPLGTTSAIGGASSSSDSRNVSIWASRGSLQSDSLTYPIYAPIAVHPSSELLLDNDQSWKVSLQIAAPSKDRLSHVKVSLSDDARDYVTLSTIGSKKEEQTTTDLARQRYMIRLRPDATFDGSRKHDDHVVIADEITGTIQRVPIRFKFSVKSPSSEESTKGGILGFLWNVLVGAKEVYGTVMLLVVSAALTIGSIYFGYKFLTGNRTGAMEAPSMAPRVSPNSIQWKSYGAQGLRSPQSPPMLWSIDPSQYSPSSLDSSSSHQVTAAGTPGSTLTKRGGYY